MGGCLPRSCLPRSCRGCLGATSDEGTWTSIVNPDECAWASKIFLASAPETDLAGDAVLATANRILEERGYKKGPAGDADDPFNRMLKKNKERWFDAWKGKVQQVLNVHANQRVDFIALKGGRQCDRERKYLSSGDFSRLCAHYRVQVRVLAVDNILHFKDMLSPSIVVSGSEDQTLRVWNLQTGQCTATLQGHQHAVWCVAVAGADRAVSLSQDHTLRVWSLQTSKCTATLQGHSDMVLCVAVAGADRVVSGSKDGTLRVWNFETGHCTATLQGHSRGVWYVAVMATQRAWLRARVPAV